MCLADARERWAMEDCGLPRFPLDFGDGRKEDEMGRLCTGCTHLACVPDGFGGGTYVCCRLEQVIGHFSSLEDGDKGPTSLQEDCWEPDSLHQPVRS